MKSLKIYLGVIFYSALLLSIMLPLGILGVVFGAITKDWVMLVFGILLVIPGFYLMPILWVKYGRKRKELKSLQE